MEQDNEKKINSLREWYLKKKFFLKNPVKLFRITNGRGDRLLSVQFFGWRGAKKKYLFQVEEELDPETEKPIPWPKRWVVEDKKDADCGCVMVSVENPSKTAPPWWNEKYSVKEEEACRDDG